MLEQTAKILGIAASFMLVVSIGYDYAYVRALGLSFAAVPTSLADHVRTAIVWAPVTGVGLVGGLLLGALNPIDSETQRARNRLLDRLWVVNVMAALFALMLTAAGFELVVLLMTTALLISARPHARPDSPLVMRYGRTMAFGLVVCPLLVLITAYIGHVQGTALFTSSPRFAVEAMLESGPLHLNDVGLRRFTAFVVAVERNNTVHVIPDSAVQRVHAKAEPPRPWRCILVSYGCRERSTSSPMRQVPQSSTEPYQPTGHAASSRSAASAP